MIKRYTNPCMDLLNRITENNCALNATSDRPEANAAAKPPRETALCSTLLDEYLKCYERQRQLQQVASLRPCFDHYRLPQK